VQTDYHSPALAMGWMLPFNFALAFHVLIIVSALTLPKYLDIKEFPIDVTSVDLINIADIALPPEQSYQPSVPPPGQKENVQTDTSPPVSAKKTAPIATPANTNEILEIPSKPISIKPLKRKIKKKIIEKASTAELRMRQLAQIKALETKRQLLIEEAQRQRVIADEEAKAATSEALSALKQSLRADADVTSMEPKKHKGLKNSGTAHSAVEGQYHSAIFSQLHQYWSLPTIKVWPPALSATVVITIDKDGGIVSHHFEKKSGDLVFDKFVSKTIEEANPLPPIPGALKKSEYTIGLHFKPGEIQ